MKKPAHSLFCLLLAVLAGLSGCTNHSTGEPAPVVTPSPSLFVPPTIVPENTVVPATTEIPVPAVNYTGIPFIGEDDPDHPMNEARKNDIIRAAVADDRVRDLLAGGGTIEGVQYQCHPTPKDYAGPACAPALRVRQNNTAWFFLVDEKSRAVIFVQHEIPGSSFW